MQPDCVHICISRLPGIQLGGMVQFLQRLISSLEPHKGQAECMMKAGILRRCGNRSSQHALAVGLAFQSAIEIGKVDGSRRILGTEPQRSLVLSLGVGSTTARREEAAERGTRFRSISIEALRCDEFGRGALEALAVGSRLT